jgi:hypothetical protein
MITTGTFVLQWFWDGDFVTNLPKYFSFAWRQMHASLTFLFQMKDL